MPARFWRDGRAGRLLGAILFLSLALVLSGRPRVTVWLVLLGTLLHFASLRASRDRRFAAALEGAKVEEAMVPPTVDVPAHASLAEAEDACFRCYAGEAFPVTRDKALVGLVLRRDLRRFSVQERRVVSVQAAMRPVPESLIIAPQEALSTGWARMSTLGVRALLVLDDGQLRGLLTAGAIGVYAATRTTPRR